MKNMNSYDFDKQHAIVTGGAQGIGLAVAQRLLDGGATVTLWDRDADLLTQTLSDLNLANRVGGEAVDISDLDAVQSATAAAMEARGRIDVLINNAAIVGPNANTWEYPPEQFKAVVEIGLTGTFYCCHSVVP